MKKKRERQIDVIIIGAGASGLMAGVTAARNGREVLILEHKDRIAKKIPATGNGKCNFTNAVMQEDCFRGNQEMAMEIYKSFDKDQTLAFFKEIGIFPKAKNGYYYPNSEQAASVVKAFQTELDACGILVETEVETREIIPQADGFRIVTNKREYHCKNLLLTTGLLASPKLGSDGSIFSVIKQLGHHFSPIVPALCGFECSGLKFKKVSGVRVHGKVTLLVDGKNVAEDTGELQLTDYGISGIPVFQVSRFASMALYEKRKVCASLDLMPDHDNEQIMAELVRRVKRHASEQTLGDALNGLLNQKLIDVLCEGNGWNAASLCADIKEAHLRQLITRIKQLTVTLQKARDYEFSQICAGGIRDDEVDLHTLESRLVPGLFFAGEILNVDGKCGGYNLQWAWSSGYAAAIHICEKEKA